MGTSAFEILFVPVLWGTFVGIVAGAVLLALMNAVEALVGRLRRPARPLPELSRTARVASRRARRSVVRGGRARGVHT
jgi:hypothetical protein